MLKCFDFSYNWNVYFSEFVSGPGQLYLYCKESPKLLNSLLNRGKNPKVSNGLLSNRRLSRSEGDLCCSNSKDTNVNDGPEYFSSNNGSEDSGVRTSLSDDCTFSKNKVTCWNLGSVFLLNFYDYRHVRV